MNIPWTSDNSEKKIPKTQSNGNTLIKIDKFLSFKYLPSQFDELTNLSLLKIAHKGKPDSGLVN